MRYRVIGEYGPCYADHEELYVEADDYDEAFRLGVIELKKFNSWSRIGEHNVSVCAWPWEIV